MTHRQYLAWREWLAEQWNRPSRTDHYLMQVAAETIRPHLKKGAKTTLADFRLSFGDGVRGTAMPQSVDENRAIWLEAASGLPGVTFTPGPRAGG